MEPNSDTATSNQSNNSAVSFKEKLDLISAVWIGVLGLALMATGLVLQSARGFLRHLIIREFGLD